MTPSAPASAHLQTSDIPRTIRPRPIPIVPPSIRLPAPPTKQNTYSLHPCLADPSRGALRLSAPSRRCLPVLLPYALFRIARPPAASIPIRHTLFRETPA